MNKMYAAAFGIAVGIIGISATAAIAAGEEQKTSYTQLKLGIMQPTGQLDEDNFDTGGDVSLLYGHYLTDYIRIEGGIDIFAVDGDSSGSNALAGQYHSDDYVTAAGLELTIKGEYPLGPVHLYGGGGVGIYSVALTSQIDSNRLGEFDKTGDDSVFGGHLVAGLDWDISDRFFLSLEGKYRVTGDVDISETVASIPVNYDGDLDGYSITAGIGFRF